MIASTITNLLSKGEEESSQTLNYNTEKAKKEAYNWSYELMAEDTYTNKPLVG